MERRLSKRSVTNIGICLTLRRVLEIYSDGFDRRSVRRALNELVRFSISVGVRASEAEVLGRMTKYRR